MFGRACALTIAEQNKPGESLPDLREVSNFVVSIFVHGSVLRMCVGSVVRVHLLPDTLITTGDSSC